MWWDSWSDVGRVLAVGAAAYLSVVVVLGVVLPWLGVAVLLTAGWLALLRLVRRRATPEAPAQG